MSNETLEQVKAERDALAAHVERIVKAAERYLKHGPGCVNIGNGTVTPVADVFRSVLSEAPTTSLDRRDAEKKAEALHELLMHPRNTAEALRGRAKEMRDDYRRQAGEATQ